MIQKFEALLDQYWSWLKKGTSLREIDGCIEITTPYLDRHNDCLQIYARPDKGEILLTDDGHILQDLEMSGFRVDSPKRQMLLDMTINGFGIELDKESGKALEVRTSEEDFPLQKHNLLQAMLAVDDLFYLATSTTTNTFHERVSSWLTKSGIRYTSTVHVSGKSGFRHLIDFIIPGSQSCPEQLGRVMHHPSRNTVLSMAFAWVDISDERTPGAKAFAVLNDSDASVGDHLSAALQKYDVNPVLWSDRDKMLTELTA